ncbi:hypothetical protein [Salinarimonas ramus]|uniref:Uncharacterized protein n=1 Tax=Salinarimonas ramus TaxID=690164 RepID=A0A917QKB6_9HYPH|nr:hypothetical protein [Salinarimonas ramus]GGK54679.1 hypothetical protein GCM10011322_46830 [Salinarimonas ramus]
MSGMRGFERARRAGAALVLIGPLLVGCAERDEPAEGADGVEVEDTPAAIEAPALAPNEIVEGEP